MSDLILDNLNKNTENRSPKIIKLDVKIENLEFTPTLNFWITN